MGRIQDIEAREEYDRRAPIRMLNREHIKYAIERTLSPVESLHSGFIMGYKPRLLKDGRPSTKRFDSYFRYYTPLYICEICKKMSTPKHVNYKYRLGYDYLCMSCWNKLRPIEKKQEEVKEVKKLINKLKRTKREKI